MRCRRFELFSVALLLALAPSLAGASAASAPEYRVVDSSGTEVLFARAPKRVIPLQPSLAELADRIGASLDEIVGVTEFTDYPPLLKSKPSVGSYAKPNLEQIVALKPDLVLAGRDGTPKETVARLRKLGIPVVTVSTETLAGLREAYGIIGAALEKKAEAARALADFDRELDQVRARAKTHPPCRVLLQVGEDPLVVAAGKTFLNEGLGVLGLTNVYPDRKRTYPRVSVEDVLKKNPDAIILVTMGGDAESFARAEKRWKTYRNLTAVKWNRVFQIRADGLVRPGPRFPAGLLVLERALFAPGRWH